MFKILSSIFKCF